MDLKIEYRDANSRRVKSLEAALTSHVDLAIADRLKDVRCPVHGRCAERVEISRSGDEITFTAGPLCCEQLKQAIAQSFSEQST